VEVLLAGKDWTARALLRAQLLEEGIDVQAYESVSEAVDILEGRPRLPALLVADLAASDNPAADADRLAGWTADVPVWIIASRATVPAASLTGRGFEKVLFRPVDMNELVEQIKRRLGRGSRP
jgi:DNA-binding NtrC family response regulator